MSDERLRELQRRWQETGLDADEAPFLLEQVRLGHLSRTRLEVAARLDHPAARLALGDAAPPREPEPGPVGRWWRRTEHEVVGRLVGWPSGTAFGLSEWVRHLESYGDDVALEAGRQLARTLEGDWPRLQRAVEALAPPVEEPDESEATLSAVQCVRIVVETKDPDVAREQLRLGLIRWSLGRPSQPLTGPSEQLAGEPPGNHTDSRDEDPVSRLTDVMLQEAHGNGEVRLELDQASERLRGVARIRSDEGEAPREMSLPPMVLAAVIARLKYLVGLDLFETERPQAGERRVPLGRLTVETYQAEGREACRALMSS